MSRYVIEGNIVQLGGVQILRTDAGADIPVGSFDVLDLIDGKYIVLERRFVELEKTEVRVVELQAQVAELKQALASVVALNVKLVDLGADVSRVNVELCKNLGVGK